MSSLRFEQVKPAGNEDVRHDWQRVHNVIVPESPLSAGQIGERAR